MQFIDRLDAAEKLLKKIKETLPEASNVLLLAIPRGGVVIGVYLRDKLKVPMDILVVKKIGHPDNPEYAIGGVGPEGQVLFADAAESGLSSNQIAAASESALAEVRRQLSAFRGEKPYPSLKGKDVILVDDGLATGITMESAVRYARQQKPKRIIVAVPAASSSALERLAPITDEIICLEHPLFFVAVGQFYVDFPQVEDEEVKKLLK